MRIGGESEQTILRLTAVRVLRADGDRPDPSHAAVRRRVQVDATASLDEEYALAGKDGELDGLLQLLGENDSGEAVLLGPCAAEVDLSRSDRVAQSTEQMPQEERLGERCLGVTHVRVPRASAIEVVIPAHRMAVAVGPV